MYGQCLLSSKKATDAAVEVNTETPTVKEPDGGMSFNTDASLPITDRYQMVKPLEEFPHTFATWLYVPKSIDGRAGSIFSNYTGKGNTTILFEVHKNGNPRLYYRDEAGTTHDIKFTDLDVRSEDWVHLAIVHEESAVVCYINGVEAGRKEDVGNYDVATLDLNFLIGGDQRAKNSLAYLGKLRDYAMYTNPLDAAAIADIYKNGVNTKAENLLVYYNMTSGAEGDHIVDLSGNGYHAGTSTFDPTTVTAAPETTAASVTTASVTAAQTSAAPSAGSSAATFDVSVLLAAAASLSGAGIVVFRKRK